VSNQKTNPMKTYISSLTAIFLFICSPVNSQNTYADDSNRVVTKALGEGTIHSNLSLTENLSEIPSFSRQVQVFKLIDFDKMIAQHQMVTVFVVHNNAFDFMDKNELEAFLSTSNRSKLTEMQAYYVIPGRVDEHAIRKAITDGNGAASFRVLDGKTIRFMLDGDAINLYAPNGSRNTLINTNYHHNKGFFHITDGLAIPQSE
jgi:uncharacterized surface protein with fasciclin (FAS1) repeats